MVELEDDEIIAVTYRNSDGTFSTIGICSEDDSTTFGGAEGEHPGPKGFVVALKVSQINKERKYKDRTWLVKAYIEEGRTMQDIADEFNVSPMTIYTWLGRFDIPTRQRGRR